MTDGQFAIGMLVGGALNDLKAGAPKLHLTAFTDAELDSLEADLLTAIPVQERLLCFIRDRKKSLVITRQEWAEQQAE